MAQGDKIIRGEDGGRPHPTSRLFSWGLQLRGGTCVVCHPGIWSSGSPCASSHREEFTEHVGHLLKKPVYGSCHRDTL